MHGPTNIKFVNPMPWLFLTA